MSCALALPSAGSPPRRHAERADRDKPIFYQGDSGGANLGSKDGELAGSVIITQGTLTIHADRIVFHQNPDNSLSATAYGNPVSFREKRDGMDEYYEGFAQRVVYNGQKRFLELFDRAVLKKSGDEIRSNYITYDAGTEVFKAEGRPDSRPPMPARRRSDPACAACSSRSRRMTRRARTARQPRTRRTNARTPSRRHRRRPPPPLQLKGDNTLSPAAGKMMAAAAR